jgi:hypothetical protein
MVHLFLGRRAANRLAGARRIRKYCTQTITAAIDRQIAAGWIGVAAALGRARVA